VNSALPFRAAIDAGVWSVMTGHIALPWADPGLSGDPYGAPPATLSRKLTTDLLRGALGFRGLVISDAIEMAGSTGRVKDAYELLARMLNAGNDMLLFSNAKRDFDLILRAVREGIVSEARVDEACSRVLALKEAMGFARNPESALPAEILRGGGAGGRPGRGREGPGNALPGPEEAVRYKTAAASVAEGAITLVRDLGGVLPLSIKKGDEILAVHLRAFPYYHVDGFDGLLSERGAEVTRKTEADDIYWYRQEDYAKYKAVLFLWVYGPTWGANIVRPSHSALRSLWFTVHEHPPCPIINVSFGSPYIHDEAPWALAWINAYSPDPESQRAAAGALLGEIPFRGRSPVDLERPNRLRVSAASLIAEDGRG